VGELHPIWVRRGTAVSGPCIPHPERHPYCEIGLTCEGEGSFFVEGEEASFRAGDITLIGTGVPHWGTITGFPYTFVTVYFLPSVLVDLRPESDGPRILRRFTARQSLSDRMVRLPKESRRGLVSLFDEIVAEFDGQEFGREIQLRTLLTQLLVALLRREQQQGRALPATEMDVDWRPMVRVLDYLRAHYTEQVYARSLAQAAGLSEWGLKGLFRRTLGMSWVKYLQGYRIHRAATLLGQPGSNVTEAAFAVGFESLSHFNMVFHSFMGVAPKVYAMNARAQAFGPAAGAVPRGRAREPGRIGDGFGARARSKVKPESPRVTDWCMDHAPLD